MAASGSQNVDSLRKTMRARRKQLTTDALKLSAENLSVAIRKTAEYQRSEHIAVYHAINGEADLSAFINSAVAEGKHCYLPLIHNNELLFIRHHQDSSLVKNRMGIPEPIYQRSAEVSASSLDLVCMPLVAYDNRGNRLGMGGGFYDRTLEKLRAAN